MTNFMAMDMKTNSLGKCNLVKLTKEEKIDSPIIVLETESVL